MNKEKIPNQRWEYIDKDGLLQKEQNTNTVAKRFLNFDENTVRHYLLISGGSIFDPINATSTYVKRRIWKFRLVDDQAYYLYLRYLGHPDKKTRGQKVSKLHAERRI